MERAIRRAARSLRHPIEVVKAGIAPYAVAALTVHCRPARAASVRPCYADGMAARTAPYRRLLGRMDGLGIWRVDGHQVRDGWDVEFTNGHHHFTRGYIPPGEIWLDREAPG